MRKIYLHVGTQKTGSSALQRFFCINKDILAEEGILYPLEWGAQATEGYSQQGGNIGRLRSLLSYPNKEIADIFINLVDRYQRILLSNEGLFVLANPNIKNGWLQEVRNANIEIDIIVYLRKQVDFILSFYNQGIKGSRSVYKEFWEWYQEVQGDKFLNYKETLDSFESIVGPQHMKVRIYEKEQFTGGSLYADFMDALGLKLTDRYRIPKEKVNVSLSNTAMQVKKIINRIGSDAGIISRLIAPTLQKLSEEEFSRGIPAHTLLSYDEKVEFMQQWEECNESIAQKYFGRKRLFFSEVKKTNASVPSEKDILEYAIQALSAALASEEKELQLLKYERMVDNLFYAVRDTVLGSWENIIVYGTGRAGRACKTILTERYRKRNLIFAQTIIQANDPREIDGIPVKEIADLKEKMSKSIVLIATTVQKNQEEMMETLEKLQCGNKVSLL